MKRSRQGGPARHGSDKQRSQYRTFFDTAPVGLYMTAPDGRFLDANAELARMLGFSDKASLLQHSAQDFYVAPQDRLAELDLLARDGGVRRFETQLRRTDGTAIWVVDTCRAAVDEAGGIVCFEGSLEDITEARRLREELQHMARHDPLTGVFNRYALDDALAREFARSQRYRHPIALLMVDIDQFKEFNDRFGHAAGDDVLRAVGSLLTRCVRSTDMVVRYGGDEFLILLIETDGEVVYVKDRIEREVGREFESTPYGVPIRVSIGAAHWSPDTGESVETLLRRADEAMYADKGVTRSE